MDWERQPGHMLPLSIKLFLLLRWPACCHPRWSWTAQEWEAPSVEKHRRGMFSCTVNSDPPKIQNQTSKERSQILRLCRVPGRSSRSSWRWRSRISKNRCSGTRGNHPFCWWRLWGPSPWPGQVDQCRNEQRSMLPSGWFCYWQGTTAGNIGDTHLDLHILTVDDFYNADDVVKHQAHFLTVVWEKRAQLKDSHRADHQSLNFIS